jgi:hypothetical protein
MKDKDEGGRMKDESVMIRLEQFFFHPSAFILSVRRLAIIHPVVESNPHAAPILFTERQAIISQ